MGFREYGEYDAVGLAALVRDGQVSAEQLLDEALDVLPALAASQGEQVLLHQDLHGDNVLSAQREPWLAIDPKQLNEFSMGKFK